MILKLYYTTKEAATLENITQTINQETFKRNTNL